jgi:hypothetical protein
VEKVPPSLQPIAIGIAVLVTVRLLVTQCPADGAADDQGRDLRAAGRAGLRRRPRRALRRVGGPLPRPRGGIQ